MWIILQLHDMAAAIIKQSGGKEVLMLQSILRHHTLPVTSIKLGTFQIHNVHIQWQCNFVASPCRHVIYRVIHNPLRDSWLLRYSSRDGHAEEEHVNRGRDTPSFCPTLQVLDVSTLGDGADINPESCVAGTWLQDWHLPRHQGWTYRAPVR